MKNKKAYISIEATFAISAILLFFTLLVGFFGYVVPRMYLEKEVQTIAELVKINGGLTAEQYNDAMVIFSKYGSDIEVNIYTADAPTIQLLDVAPKGTEYLSCMDATEYVPFARRSDGQKIIVRVKMKIASQQLLSVLSAVGISSLVSEYSVYEVVVSERNQC